jgi:hypothetical protein
VGENRSHTVATIQRRVIIACIILGILAVAIGAPLIINGDLRLNVAHRLHLAPGWNAEQIADGDSGETLVVVPLPHPLMETGRELYRYRALYLATPVGDGLELTEIDTGRALTIPVGEFDLVSADEEGEHVLFRGADPSGEDTAVLVDVAAATATVLPEGQTAPDMPGDWDTPVWEKTVGSCDRYSVSGKLLACFNRADAASYFAGDWQVDIQVYGDFERSEAVYRGTGFLPVLGWAHDDADIYVQNEKGIWRVPVPQDLRAGT